MKWFCENYPAIANHLFQFEDDAKKRQDKGDYWWELRACEYYDEFEKPKIMLPDISQGEFYIGFKRWDLLCKHSLYNRSF